MAGDGSLNAGSAQDDMEDFMIREECHGAKTLRARLSRNRDVSKSSNNSHRRPQEQDELGAALNSASRTTRVAQKESGSVSSQALNPWLYDCVKGILSLGRNSGITMDFLESVLSRDYGGRMTMKEKNAFKVAAVLFADAYFLFLAPKDASIKVKEALSECKKCVSLVCCLMFLKVL